MFIDWPLCLQVCQSVSLYLEDDITVLTAVVNQTGSLTSLELAHQQRLQLLLAVPHGVAVVVVVVVVVGVDGVDGGRGVEGGEVMFI